MVSILKGSKLPIKVWAPVHEIESSALDQLRVLGNLPHVVDVCSMPDVHAGLGVPIGTVLVTKGAVIASAVGVDPGCGMTATLTSLTADDIAVVDLKALREELESRIPVGFNSHASAVYKRHPQFVAHGNELVEKIASIKYLKKTEAGNAAVQAGTLGGGNHFVELALDRQDRVWLMLHSGSRHFGKAMAEHFIHLSKELAAKQRVPSELGALEAGTAEFDAYVTHLAWAQDYAAFNRAVMSAIAIDVLKAHWSALSTSDYVSCHHNYTVFDSARGVWVTRKGAIHAGAGTRGIIPGAMGRASFIVEGLGSAESYESASHGAGRVMSRSAAKRTFDAAAVVAGTAGVECRKDTGVADEHPNAYKDINTVMGNQIDLVRPIEQLSAFICIKG